MLDSTRHLGMGKRLYQKRLSGSSRDRPIYNLWENVLANVKRRELEEDQKSLLLAIVRLCDGG